MKCVNRCTLTPISPYAIPDCDDIPGVDQKTGAGGGGGLNAVRDHLENTDIKAHKLTVDDLHQGWFGVNPNQFGDEFWNGAVVTIRKLDKVDEDTGYKESGQVRFYAKWGDNNGDYYGIFPYDLETLEPHNLVESQYGVNGRPGEGVYGSKSTIPDEAEFWMEGVRPGKITLEWRYQKGAVDRKFEQSLLVATQKPKQEWFDEVRYQIRLQTKVETGDEVDIALYHAGNGFRNTKSTYPPENDNVARVQALYYYYQQLYKQMPDKFVWAGMAKTAAAPIYAGMSDLTSWAQFQDVARPGEDFGTPTHLTVQGLLCAGQLKIFDDKAWAHRAYLASDRWALNWVRDNTSGVPPTDFDAWDNLYIGINDSDQSVINSANGVLLEREQLLVVQESYTSFATNFWFYQPKTYIGLDNIASWLLNFEVVTEDPGLGANVGEWLSANALKNPIPGGPGLRDTIPGGRIDSYPDRWVWISNPTNGMLHIWTGDAVGAATPKFDSGKRLLENNKTMLSAGSSYSFDTGGLPNE